MAAPCWTPIDLAQDPFLRFGDRENQQLLADIRERTSPSGGGNDGFVDTFTDVFTSSFASIGPGGGAGGGGPLGLTRGELQRQDRTLFNAEIAAREEQRQRGSLQRQDRTLFNAERRNRAEEITQGLGDDGNVSITQSRALSVGGETNVDVQAPVDVQIEASLDDLERELDRRLEQIKSEILREVSQRETTGSISSRQQRSFQKNF